MEYYYQGGLIFCGVPGQSGTPQNIVGSQGKVILEFLDNHQFTDITVDPGQSGSIYIFNSNFIRIPKYFVRPHFHFVKLQIVNVI